MRGGTWRLALAAALFGAATLSFAITPAEAASRACRQLRAELAAVSGSGGGPALLAKYDDAIARQRDELAKARSQSRAAGCGFSLFGTNVTQCAVINAALDRINANLDMLERKRARLAGGGSRRDRTRLQAMLDAGGCNGPDAGGRTAGQDREQRTVRILGGGDVRRIEPPDIFGQTEDTGEGSASGRIIDLRGMPSGGGEYRTMCVRTCDGYFFPMSTAASSGDFERDQKNCESSCPGTQIELFYTRGFADDSAGMISTATGRPYSELATAYLYKKPNVPMPRGCGCNAARGFQVIAGNPPAAGLPGMETDEPSSFVPVPVERPDPAADPETLANAAGGLDPDAIRKLASRPVPAAEAPVPAEERKIRVVGPTFLPDPQGAIDLRVPAPKTAR